MFEKYTQQKDTDPENCRYHDIETVQEAQLGVLEQILHPRKIRGEVLVRHEPAHVAPKKAVLHRRVHVIRLIRVDMVVAMMCRPPNRPALHRRGAQQSEYELPDARGLEAAVREIAVIETRDGEHAHHIGCDCYADRHWTNAGPDRGQAGQVHQ